METEQEQKLNEMEKTERRRSMLMYLTPPITLIYGAMSASTDNGDPWSNYYGGLTLLSGFITMVSYFNGIPRDDKERGLINKLIELGRL